MAQNLKFLLGKIENIQEKEKMLVTSIFSYSYNVFQRLPSQANLNILDTLKLLSYYRMTTFDAPDVKTNNRENLLFDSSVYLSIDWSPAELPPDNFIQFLSYFTPQLI